MSLIIKNIRAEETWPLRHQVMWPNEDIEYVKLPEDKSGIHYGLFVNNKLTAVVSLFINDREAQFRKLATARTAQGNGYGTMLLKHLIQETEVLKVNRIWCNARADKASFYHRFGLKETARTFIKNGQSYVVMERVL